MTVNLELDTCSTWVGLRVMLGPDQHQNVLKLKGGVLHTLEDRRGEKQPKLAAEESIFEGDVY